jgi:hypothetical protein
MELMAILFIVHPKWNWCNHGGWVVTQAKISVSGTITPPTSQPTTYQPWSDGVIIFTEKKNTP